MAWNLPQPSAIINHQDDQMVLGGWSYRLKWESSPKWGLQILSKKNNAWNLKPTPRARWIFNEMLFPNTNLKFHQIILPEPELIFPPICALKSFQPLEILKFLVKNPIAPSGGMLSYDFNFVAFLILHLVAAPPLRRPRSQAWFNMAIVSNNKKKP